MRSTAFRVLGTVAPVAPGHALADLRRVKQHLPDRHLVPAAPLARALAVLAGGVRRPPLAFSPGCPGVWVPSRSSTGPSVSGDSASSVTGLLPFLVAVAISGVRVVRCCLHDLDPRAAAANPSARRDRTVGQNSAEPNSWPEGPAHVPIDAVPRTAPDRVVGYYTPPIRLCQPNRTTSPSVSTTGCVDSPHSRRFVPGL